MTYSIIQADASAGRAPLLNLWRRNLPRATPERYAWLYGTGPACTWLAQDDDGEPIGATGLMTRDLLIHQRLCRAGQAIDLNVDRGQRTMGLALDLQRSVVESLSERGLDFVYAIPGKQAAPIQRRVGYQEVGPIDQWTKPLSAEYKLRQLIKPRLPAKALAWLMHPWMRWRYGEKSLRNGAHHQPVALSAFDGRFNELWKHAAPQFAIFGERSAAYLTWRFHQYPGIVYRIFGLADAAGGLEGYVVYRSEANDAVCISDFLFKDQNACTNLIAAFSQQMRQERVQAIHLTFLGPAWLGNQLTTLGFCQRATQDVLLVYANEESGIDETLLTDRNNWFFTRADLDVEG